MNPLIEFTKWLFKWIALITLGIPAVVIGGPAAWHWLNHDRHVPNIKVIVATEHSPPDPAWPVGFSCEHLVFVSFVNNSSRTVE